jgi:hypothetical protein
MSESAGRPRWPGRTALALGILTPVLVVVGIVATGLGAVEFATVATWVALATSGLAVLGGIVAAIGNWERGAAIGGIVLGVLGNPLVLTFGLGTPGSV